MIVKNQDSYWLKHAQAVARKSPHPTNKVGAVLVDAKGRLIAAAYNRFAEGVVAKKERFAEGKKTLWINCAEQMALATAARRGVKVRGAACYVTLEPCAVCAGLLAEIGVKYVCVPANARQNYPRLKLKWKRSIAVGVVKLREAGVKLLKIAN